MPRVELHRNRRGHGEREGGSEADHDGGDVQEDREVEGGDRGNGHGRDRTSAVGGIRFLLGGVEKARVRKLFGRGSTRLAMLAVAALTLALSAGTASAALAPAEPPPPKSRQ